MKPSKRTTNAALCCGLLAVVSSLATQDLSAEQQQNANHYVYWTFDGSPTDITSIDQEIWIPVPANAFQWVLGWSFAPHSPGDGGYLGFNVDAAGNAQMLFSIWNATASTASPGAACAAFGGEGTGLSCRKPLELNKNVFYRLHLERTKVETDGTWWMASISEEKPDGGTPTEHPLGSLRVPTAATVVKASSVYNFIEYFGKVVACSAVPVSGYYASEPRANPRKTDLGYHYTAKIMNFPGGEKCTTGDETHGANFVGQSGAVQCGLWQGIYPDALPSDRGAFLFLGGKQEQLDVGTIMGRVPVLPKTIVIWKRASEQ